MTVFGATTAVVAPTPYTPPYKYVTSYAPAPSVVGTATRPVSNNPTLAPGSSSGDYAWAYLSAHMMSWPSYRYIYLLWIIFAFIALLYILAHHLRLGASTSGATLSKWAIRRQPIGKRRSGGARGRALASNGVLLTSFILFVIAVLLSFLGPDYIAPAKGVLSFSRRQFPIPGQTQYASPSYTISKSFWTMASRLGDTAFSLIPLTVLLAMKSPPVAILAWRGLAHLYSDKLATFHKITAWMVWGATTGHVALWTVQLFMDKNNGSAAWFAMWTNYRFIAGVVAYTAMTGVMVTSFRIVRQKQYEFFYITHVTLVFLTIALSAVHHPVLWFWMAAALLIWALERLWRMVRVWRINGRSSSSSQSSRTKSNILASQYEDLPQSDSYAMADLPSRPSNTDKSLPRQPGTNGIDSPGEWSPASTRRGSFDVGYSGKNEFGQHQRDGSSGYAEGSLQTLGAFEGRYSTSGTAPARTNGGFADPYDAPSQNKGRGVAAQGSASAQRVVPGAMTSTPTSSGLAPIPTGQALAQLLPSRTIRLTIHLSRPIKWSPGQSILLYIPELSKIQSHPFTITNGPNSEGEIVILVKARKGLTRRLYDLVRDRHQSNLLMGKNGAARNGQQGNVDTAPVFVGAKVDGPFGSAGRVRWGDHATVIIICGGSGVSFGMAVLEGVCKSIREGKGGKTTRVRFCWVAREYAEIAWVAFQLQRCQSLLPPSQLQIEIYITNSVPLPPRTRHHQSRNHPPNAFSAYEQPSAASSFDSLAPPRAAFAKSAPRPSGSGEQDQQPFGRRSASMDSIASIASDMSVDEVYGRGYSDHLEVDEHISDNYADVIDLTNYEDEEDIIDPREEALSSSVREQGKIRRARSRKVGKVRDQGQGQGGRRGSGLVPADRTSGHGTLPSRLSGMDRFADDGMEGEGRGMSKSASAPNGITTLQHPVPRSGRIHLAPSAYDQLSPAGSSSTVNIDGGRRSSDQPRSASTERNRAPRPYTSYDLTPRPTSASSGLSNPYVDPQPLNPNQHFNSLAPPHAILPVGAQHHKRNSYASSYADPYAAYDPFAGPGPRGSGGLGGTHSPGASIRAGSSIHHGYFDDADRGSVAGDSIRPIYSSGGGADTPGGGFRASRTGSMVLLDEPGYSDRDVGKKRHPSDGRSGKEKRGPGEGLWIDMADYESMSTMSELAISGKPALGALLDEEIERAGGSLIVATCGPTTLNTVVRNLVANHISPSKIRKGDKRGHIAIYSEDYDA